ncbi:hypothetical protein FAGAP_4970 [Fusarium agapanthi]|uniref:Uncharacterized protein n=1 Tax=Fusarium agapanthi TaxID=1803897 RepID=A0A9P5BC03_9HYPO|nr:hypothetical protein FAGAP_4970 [Fusarium agapanthi]
MVSFYQLNVFVLGLLAWKSQASLLGDAHLLKRYPQAYELPPAATHLTTSILPGNDTSIRTSIQSLLPIPTRRLVDESTLHSLHSFGSTGINSGTSTEGSIGQATSEALSLLTGSIPAPSSAGGTSATPDGIDWTALLPGTPTTGEPFFSTTQPLTGQYPAVTEPSKGVTADRSFDAGSSGATMPTTDTAIQQFPTNSSNHSIASTSLATSETSRGGAESQEPGTTISTDNPPSETSSFMALPEGTTGTYEPTSTAIQTQDDLGSTNPSSEDLTASNAASHTIESSQPGMESGTTKLETLTSFENSSDMAQISTTPQATERVTTSVQKSMATEKTLPISKQPTITELVPPSTVASQNSIFTGTDGTVVTYVPEQNKDYMSSTGTTITTDDSGTAIVIFPFGWYWKLDGVPGGGGVAKPPAPTASPVPEKEPGNKNEDDNDKDEDDASTKEDEKSTIVSTVLSTTRDPHSATTTTEETTSSEECTVATQPDCTRTVSYMTSDGTQIMTEFGDCPTIVSCATETQATATVTLTPEFIWAGAEVFGDDDGRNDTETATLTGSTTSDESITTSLTNTDATSTFTSDGSTNAVSVDLTSNTEAASTFTTGSDTYSRKTVPSTFITKTRGTSDTTGTPISTGEEVTRTYYPCVIYGGPAVEAPYCQCSTTISSEGYYATTSLVDDQCIAYTEFPSQITAAPETGPITDEPIQQPITTTTDGTVLVWSAYVLDYINIPGITKITQSVGVGEPSTVSTPLPSQTAVDNDGGGQCGTGDGLSKKGLREACDRAIDKYDDDTVYSDYASRYSRSTKGILVAASVGQAACVAKFQCDDYGIGMKGSDIKRRKLWSASDKTHANRKFSSRESAKENDGVDICGHIRLSNSCTIIMDYCTNCKTRG